MINLLPQYQLLQQSNTQLILECYFSADYPYFEGHFPDTPILAGVVQLGIVQTFVKQFWQLNLNAATIRQIKFQKLIFRNSTVLLQIMLEQQKNQLTFSYHLADEIASSGILLL